MPDERNHPMGHSGEGAPLPPTKEEIAANPGKYADTNYDFTKFQVPILRWAEIVRSHRFGDALGEKMLGHPPTGEKYGVDNPEDPNEEPGAGGSLNNWGEAYQATKKTAILYVESFGNVLGTKEHPVHANWELLAPSQRARMGLKPGDKVVNPW